MLPAKLPSDSNQKKILKAFKKIGWEILPPRYGKGSHRVVRCPRTGTETTVQYHTYKEALVLR